MTGLLGRWPIWDTRYLIKRLAMSCGATVFPPVPERKHTTTWAAIVRSHQALLAGTDFFTAEVLTLRGLATYYVLFFIHLESRRVDIAGIIVHPGELWMKQIARNVTMEDCGALRDCRYLLHDRDTKFTRSFRAATVRNILDFPSAFSPPADVITLDRNYRSTQPVLAAANGVIELASERFTKNLWTERQSAERPQLVSVRDEGDQARYIADRVLENREGGTILKQQAVLFRTSSHSGQLEVELTRRNIPFVKFGGLKFLDSTHVKDMLAMLRFAQNPRDRVAGFRLLQLMPGVGPSSAQHVLDRMAEQPEPVTALSNIPAPPRSGDHWMSFVEALQQLSSGKTGWPGEIEHARRWYEPHLERIHEDASVRQADLLQLEQIAEGYSSRERFLTELTLDPPDATSDQAGVPLLDEDYLILSTIHSAKGQEWKSVFLLNVVDGCMPSDLGTGTTAEIEEERRLLYVAMTRAKDNLSLLMPQRFFTHGQNPQGDRHVYASRTRFIPASLLKHFESTTWPQSDALARERLAARQVRIDVGARMRGMWR